MTSICVNIGVLGSVCTVLGVLVGILGRVICVYWVGSVCWGDWNGIFLSVCVCFLMWDLNFILVERNL